MRPAPPEWVDGGMPDYVVSLFATQYDNRPKQRRYTWPELAQKLVTKRIAKAKNRLALWSPAVFVHGKTRAKAHVGCTQLLALDYDSGALIDDALATWGDYAYAIHTSWSHTDEHHKFRVVLPLAQSVVPSDFARLWQWAFTRAKERPDPACKDPSRMYYAPGCRQGGIFDAYRHDGPFLDPAAVRLPPPRRGRLRPRAPRLPPVTPTTINQELLENPEARDQFARQNGWQISGGWAKGASCPRCGRRDIVFAINVDKKRKAWCNHKNSCGWEGHLWALI